MPQQVIKMPLSYFGDEKDNGNISLTSISQKVDDASKLLTGDTVIELDNGVQCSTREELFFAASHAVTNLGKRQSEPISSPNEEKIDSKGDANISKTLIVIAVSLIIAAIIWAIINANYTTYAYDDSFTGPVVITGLPYGWGMPVFIALFAVCALIGLIIVRKRK